MTPISAGFERNPTCPHVTLDSFPWALSFLEQKTLPRDMFISVMLSAPPLAIPDGAIPLFANEYARIYALGTNRFIAVANGCKGTLHDDSTTIQVGRPRTMSPACSDLQHKLLKIRRPTFTEARPSGATKPAKAHSCSGGLEAHISSGGGPTTSSGGSATQRTSAGYALVSAQLLRCMCHTFYA